MTEAMANKLIYLAGVIILVLFACYHLHLGLPIPEWLIGAISTALGILFLKNGVNFVVKRANSGKRK